MGNIVLTGLTGDGSALIDGGTFHEVLEIDAVVTHRGFYVNQVYGAAPYRIYNVGWIGLSLLAPVPGTSTPLLQWLTAGMFIDSDQQIFTEPAPNSTNFPWGADTVLWGFKDSIVTLNLWWP